MVHKLNTEREPFKWQDDSWLQYRKLEKNVMYYKTTLKEDDQFKTLIFLRYGKWWQFICEN